MTGMRTKAALVVLAVAPAAVSAEPIIYNLPEETARFQPGPGVDVAEANCLACHSADYISTQPPQQGKTFWQAEVTKMIKLYGAPIAEQDVSKIAEYLAATY
jgi:sulfite dehydrogenase (cytochrome) subunit B